MKIVVSNTLIVLEWREMMVSHSDARLDALITIVDYGLKDVLKNIFKSNNAPILLLTHGKGSAKSVVYEILGYGPKKRRRKCSNKSYVRIFDKKVNIILTLVNPEQGCFYYKFQQH